MATFARPETCPSPHESGLSCRFEASFWGEDPTERSTLAQRGHSKQKRHDLRLLNLALLVCRAGQIPLCSCVYEGNRVDVTAYPESLTHIRERLEALSLSLKDITLGL